MKTAKITHNEKLIERLLLGTALATLAGYLGLAWSILHKERRPGTSHGMK